MSSASHLKTTSVSTQGGNSPGSFRDSGIEDAPSPKLRSKRTAATSWEEKPRVRDEEDANSPSASTLSDSDQLGVQDDMSRTSAQDSSGVSGSGTDDHDVKIPDDPFTNKKSQILFDAIDSLQSWGSHKFLDIPQLVIVGEQSSGKSSLLKSLTDIPFPIQSGCCTRFPIRVVSRRTVPGSSDSFRIVVERPLEGVKGLQSADPAAYEYSKEGDTLTATEFESALEELSEHMGIRPGRGQHKKNFVPDVVKIELSGPKRSPFSILDLPGVVNSSFNINEPEIRGTHKLAEQYISREENIVVCTIPATTELSNLSAFEICCKRVVNKERLIGVFTKCDEVKRKETIETLVSSTHGNIGEGGSTFQGGAFVVCNKVAFESGISNPESAEQEVFDQQVWSGFPSCRKGSIKLKNHLAEVLTSRIDNALPLLEKDIQSQLLDKQAKKKGLGEPFENHSERQAYLNKYVRKYSDRAVLALKRPGILGSETMELRQKITELNNDFGMVMRCVGLLWAFEDIESNPDQILNNYNAMADNSKLSDEDKYRIAGEILTPVVLSPEHYASGVSTIPAFDDFKCVRQLDKFKGAIKAFLAKFGASQPPGVINSDIYPVIYRLQVSKWSEIAQEHLERVKDALRRSYEEILRSACPDSGSTSILHQELNARLQAMFSHTSEEVTSLLNAYCEQETGTEFLQTNNPQFSQKLDGWRFVRFVRAFLRGSAYVRAQQLSPSGEMKEMRRNTDITSEDRMVDDIHDVVKVYYVLALESFIRHVTQTIVEGFVMDKDGPLSKLTSDYVLSLSEKEVEKMCREDEATTEMRKKLAADIKKLEGAQKIARDKLWALKAV